GRVEERFLPGGGDVDAESPFIGCARFTAADLACGFVHRTIERVAVDGRGARIQPKRWRAGGLRDSAADCLRRQSARVGYLAAIRGRVPAIDAAAGEID